MKKIIAFIIAITILFSLATIISSSLRIDNRYVLIAGVCKTEENLVTTIDSTGNLWEFFCEEEPLINEKCVLIMDSCGTNDVTDDEIISVYS